MEKLTSSGMVRKWALNAVSIMYYNYKHAIVKKYYKIMSKPLLVKGK